MGLSESMSHTLYWLNDRDIAHLVLEGPISGRRIYIANAELYGHAAFPACSAMIWEFAENAHLKDMEEEHGELFGAADLLVSQTDPGKKIALVSKNARTSMIFDAYKDFMDRNNSSWEVGVFEDFEKALAWCEED